MQDTPFSMEAWYQGCQTFSYAAWTTPYRRDKPQDGPTHTLVCLHGFPTSSWDFAPIWGPLSARFDCVAFDLLGMGKASKPQYTLTVGLQADLTEALCAALGIQEAHILAHDLGDTVAQELLARQAQGCAKVRWLSCVFLNGGLFPETHRPRFIQTLLASRIGWLVAKLSTERTFRKNLTQIFGPQTPPSEDFLRGNWELMAAQGREVLPFLIRYMAERRLRRTRWIKPMLDGIVPMRLINGTSDPVSGRHAADRYDTIIPNPDVVRLEDIGHYPHVEAPDAVLDALWAFFDRVIESRDLIA